MFLMDRLVGITVTQYRFLSNQPDVIRAAHELEMCAEKGESIKPCVEVALGELGFRERLVAIRLSKL